MNKQKDQEIADLKLMLGYPAPARKAPTSLSAKPKKDFIVENKLKVLKKKMARN